MISRRWLSIVVALASVCLVRSRLWAAPLQLQGELTITNTTDQLPLDSSFFDLPAGTVDFEFNLIGRNEQDPFEILADGDLASDFWPGPGQSHGGPLVIDFLTPGPGLIEVDPLRVDGLFLDFVLRAPSDTRGGGGPLPGLGSSFEFPIIARLRTRGTAIGTASLRVNDILPEPASLVLFMSGVCLATAARNARTGQWHTLSHSFKGGFV